MSAPTCSKCGAELLPEVNFCRKCGAAIANSSELPTRTLDPPPENTSTRRLDPRVTNPEPILRVSDLAAQAPPVKKEKRRWAPLVAIGVVLLVSMCVLAWVTLIRPIRPANATAAADSPFFYPGAKTIVDAPTSEGRAIHLQTSDAFDKVVTWYTAKLKPSKTMQLTDTITVLKNGKVTATIAADSGQTNILIKEATP